MLRVLYTAGSGNAFDAFSAWKQGMPDKVNSHVGYSWQMFQTCHRYNASALISCSHREGEEQTDGRIALVRRPDLTIGKSGLAFHYAQRQKAYIHVQDAIAFDANLVIIAEDTNPAYYGKLRRRGVRIIQALHTRLWRHDRPRSILQKLRARSARLSYQTGEITVLSASNVVSKQIEDLCNGKIGPVLEFLPLYRPDYYTNIPQPSHNLSSLQIAFIGRVETEKGALDLVEIASRLHSFGADFRFHICGIGGALDRMKSAVSFADLEGRFSFHGWCDRAKLRNVLQECHLTIVPTRSEFVEGFNHVVVESILAGRPCIASDICPAAFYVSGAVLIIKADDIGGYVEAIATLARDRSRLQEMSSKCSSLAARFTDPTMSFGSALEEIFEATLSKRQIRERRIPLDG